MNNIRNKDGRLMTSMETNEKSLQNLEDAQDRDDLLFVSTLDGFIHAYTSENKELWKVNLGKPLVSSDINSQQIIYEKNAIIPGIDGNIYYYDSDSEEGKSLKVRSII
jgi:hypothetical protein